MQSGRWATSERNGLRLSGSVGPGRRNDPADLRRARAALSALGWLPREDSPGAAAAIGLDQGLHRAIQRFQSDSGLEPDGLIEPQGGTIARIRYRLEDRRDVAQSESGAVARTPSVPRPVLRPPLRKAGSGPRGDAKPTSWPALVRDEGVRTQWGTAAPPPEQSLAYEGYTDHRLVDPDSYTRPFDVASRDARLFTDSAERRT